MLYTILGLLALVQLWALGGAAREGAFHWVMVVGPAIVIFAFLIIRNITTNERELLRDGVSLTGRVTEVANSPKGAMVSFTFWYDGTKHERTARDTTDNLKVGDEVSIYADPERPGRCVVNPGTFYELAD